MKQFASLSAADWVLNVHKSLLSLISVRSPEGRGSLPNGPWDGRSAVSYQVTEVTLFLHHRPINFSF